MLLVSSVDVAISLAKQAGTLRITEAVNRFGDTYFYVKDDRGIITTSSSVGPLGGGVVLW